MDYTLSVTIESPGTPLGPVPAYELIYRMNKTILIIDDDRSMRRAMRLLLESHGFDCKEADDGLAALALLDAGLLVDVILSDYHMPVINGVNFLKGLTFRGSEKEMRVIVLSGNITNEMERNAREAGAFAVMAKPYDPQKLVAAVCRACTQQNS